MVGHRRSSYERRTVGVPSISSSPERVPIIPTLRRLLR